MLGSHRPIHASGDGLQYEGEGSRMGWAPGDPVSLSFGKICKQPMVGTSSDLAIITVDRLGGDGK